MLGAVGIVFERVCEVVGLDPEKYAPGRTNLASIEGMHFDAHLREWISERTATDVVDAFNAARVPCSPVMSAAAMAADPHCTARQVHLEWEDPQVGLVKGSGVAARFPRTSGRVWRGSVPPGHDNVFVYRERLGLSEQDLAALRECGVV